MGEGCPNLQKLPSGTEGGLVRKQILAGRGNLTNRYGIVWVQVARAVKILGQGLGKFQCLPRTYRID